MEIFTKQMRYDNFRQNIVSGEYWSYNCKTTIILSPHGDLVGLYYSNYQPVTWVTEAAAKKRAYSSKVRANTYTVFIKLNQV